MHDLIAAEEEPAMCLECARSGCVSDGEVPCQVFEGTVVDVEEREEAEEVHVSAPSGMDAYLKQFE